ncbi:MAG: helicase-related protein [Myxococcota bacterium]
MSTFPVGALIRNREAPEDGPGRVIGEGEGGTIKVVFENTEDVRDITIAHTDIVRLPLIQGMLVEVSRGQKSKTGEIVEVDWPETPSDLCVYIVDCDGTEDTVFESHVTPLTPETSDPLEQFEKMHWRGPFRFFTRWDMHRMVSRWYEDSEGLPTLIGARAMPSVAPVYGARQVLCDDETRHLICHDDPVARRYSAGMVVQSILSEDPDRRVLVVAPGSLSREWRWELETRFGGHDFVRVDATHLERAPEDRWHEILERDRVVLSGSTLEHFADVCPEVVIDGDWDVVVVDDLASLRDSLYAWGCVRGVADTAERFLGLCPMPRTWNPGEIFSLVELVRPGWTSPDDFDEHYEAKMDIWTGIEQGHALLGADDFDADAFRSRFDGTLAADEYGRETLDEVESASDAAEFLAYARKYHGLETQICRVARDQVVDGAMVRNVERLEYEPNDAEASIAKEIEKLDAGGHPAKRAMVMLYRLGLASSPGRFFGLIEQRLDALEGTPDGDFETSPVTLLASDPDIGEEAELWQKVLERAPELDGESEWIASTMSLAGQWHAESGEACARFVNAVEWLDTFLDEVPETDIEEDEEPPLRKVLVYCRTSQTVEDFAMYARLKLGDEAVETAYSGMPADVIDESCRMFRANPDTLVLVVDEAGSQGRDVSRADGILHLELPTSALRLERRMARVDAPTRDPDKPVHTAMMIGGGLLDQTCAEYFDALGVPQLSLRDAEFEGAVIDREFYDVLTNGPAEDVIERASELRDGQLDDDDRAYQAVIRLTDHELEEALDFTDLLDFVDGVSDSLPIRHWARMLGMNDHGAGAGTFEFKWHWNNMRRGLRGFDSPSGELELDLLSPEKRVGLRTGTFSRKRALRNESLDYFAPGNRFLDSLVADALGPTDGRATAFARRLGPDGRGKTYVVVVAEAHPDEEAWGDAEMPKGLLSRAYRHLWPETASAIVEVDLDARREPRVVEDWDLIQRIEESYQGPEADQKLEYEMMAKAMGDASRFRAVLRNAVNVGLAHLQDERTMLVDAAAEELESMLAGELAYLERLEKSELPGADSASKRREWRDALIESVKNEAMTLDSLAFIVGGTPETLIQ